MEIVRVVAAIIQSPDGYLLARRAPEKHHGGMWEFPGGKVEIGESEEEALVRELFEEQGVVAEIGTRSTLVRLENHELSLSIQSYFASISGEISLDGSHSEYRRVSLAEIAQLELAPADQEIAAGIAS